MMSLGEKTCLLQCRGCGSSGLAAHQVSLCPHGKGMNGLGCSALEIPPCEGYALDPLARIGDGGAAVTTPQQRRGNEAKLAGKIAVDEENIGARHERNASLSQNGLLVTAT